MNIWYIRNGESNRLNTTIRLVAQGETDIIVLAKTLVASEPPGHHGAYSWLSERAARKVSTK
jgi:hypothetical protein